MAISSFRRYERKFHLKEEQLKIFEEFLDDEMKVDKYCTNGRSYKVYNIYYDTPYNDIIRESVDKPYYKEKMRLRTYSLNDEKAPVFLELKKKIGKLVTKRRIQMSRDDYMCFVKTGQLPLSNDSQIAHELAYYLSVNDVNPNVFLSYERRAFFGKEDDEFRITFDKNILARRDNLEFEYGDIGIPLCPSDFYLMEVKFENCLPKRLSRILSDNNIFSSSFSKYGTEYRIDVEKKRSELLATK